MSDKKNMEDKKEPLKVIMEDIEAYSEKKTIELVKTVNLQENDDKTNIDEFGEKLQKIIADGEKDFVKRTGRRMTYTEMRSMFG